MHACVQTTFVQISLRMRKSGSQPTRLTVQVEALHGDDNACMQYRSGCVPRLAFATQALAQIPSDWRINTSR